MTLNLWLQPDYLMLQQKGNKGVYQHYADGHLHRYVAEFEFC